MATMRRGFRRARPRARWTAADLAEVVEAVLRTSPGVLWSADDLRERLAFGLEGGGPPASSVREALRALEGAGRIERVEVWGRVGWGGTRHAYRATSAGAAQQRLRFVA
jgi:hypothetical protein